MVTPLNRFLTAAQEQPSHRATCHALSSNFASVRRRASTSAIQSRVDKILGVSCVGQAVELQMIKALMSPGKSRSP